MPTPTEWLGMLAYGIVQGFILVMIAYAFVCWRQGYGWRRAWEMLWEPLDADTGGRGE